MRPLLLLVEQAQAERRLLLPPLLLMRVLEDPHQHELVKCKAMPCNR